MTNGMRTPGFSPPRCEKHNRQLRINWTPLSFNPSYVEPSWECPYCISERDVVSLAPEKWVGWPEGAEQ